LDFAGTPDGAEACVASCARSVTHLRDALPRVLVGSLAPAADAAKYASAFGSETLMALIVATLLLFAAGPFVLWPLIKTPPDENQK
jgi:uncharacterized MAPEG superfamily protein